MKSDSKNIQIESLEIKNFKVFKRFQLNKLPQFCVIVGANGSGKSTLFDIFGFLKDCLSSNVNRAVQSRGGFKEILSRECDPERDDIEIKIKYRMLLNEAHRLVTYHLIIGPEKKTRKIHIKLERLSFKRGQHGQPFHFLDFADGQGKAVVNEKDFDDPNKKLQREDQNLDAPDILAIKGLGQFQKFKGASAFRSLLENWHVSDFHINLARGSKDAAGYYDHLSVSGDNLQLVSKSIYENHPETFRKIIERMKQSIPGIQDVSPIDSLDGRLLLGFKDGSFKDPFIDKFVSDGTLKMFAYLTLLYDPQPHPLLCVEEPENQLHPSLLETLAEEFRNYAFRGGQVFVSTHSYDFLNATQINEVFWLKKQNGFTTAVCAAANPQIQAYMDDGDKMGRLWKQGFFEGADPQ